MKKFLMSVALVAAIAAGYSMIGSGKSEMNMNELASANVEALAQSVDFGPFCAAIVSNSCKFPDVPAVGVLIDKDQ